MKKLSEEFPDNPELVSRVKFAAKLFEAKAVYIVYNKKLTNDNNMCYSKETKQTGGVR